MSHRYLPECLDRSLKDIMNKDLLFGGKLLILGGDFRQILPVVRRSQGSTLVQSCLKKSPLWQNCQVFHLTTNMRLLNCLNNNDLPSHARLHRHKQMSFVYVNTCSTGAPINYATLMLHNIVFRLLLQLFYHQ